LIERFSRDCFSYGDISCLYAPERNGVMGRCNIQELRPTNPTDAIQKWARNSEKAIAAIDLTLEYSIIVLVKWFATHLRTDRQRCWV